jgi:site-specific DNA recombinase
MKITEGVRAAKESGRWLGVAPNGYANASDEQKKPIIVPNLKASIVKSIFMDIAKGKTQSEVRHELRKKTVYISSSALSRLIRNRVYIGQIFVKGNDNKEGHYVKGLHQPLIEQALFDKVQETIEINFLTKKVTKAKCFRPELYLRGLIGCVTAAIL